MSYALLIIQSPNLYCNLANQYLRDLERKQVYICIEEKIENKKGTILQLRRRKDKEQWSLHLF